MPDVMWYASRRYFSPTSNTTVALRSGLTAFQLPDGTAALPSLTFSADPDTGLFRSGGNNLAFSSNGAVQAGLDSVGLGVISSATLAWTDGTGSPFTTKDTSLSRSAGGIIGVKSTFNFTGPSTVLPGSATASPFGYIIVQHEGASRYIPMWK